jgi:hypothetical protein
MVAPESPRFPVRWLGIRRPEQPAWLSDDTWVPPGERKLYRRARTGIHAIAERLDTDAGTVQLPAYAPPLGVAWPFVAAGFDVEYYPVSRDLSLPADAVRDSIGRVEPDAVVFIHYFGFRDDAYPELAEFARDAGATVLEDCARGLLSRTPDGELLGADGEFAVYSLRKTLPVPQGGLVVTGDVTLPDPVEREGVDLTWFRNTVKGVARRIAGGHPRLNGDNKYSNPTELADEARPLAPSELDRLTRVGLAQSNPAMIRARRRTLYRELRRLLVAVSGVRVVTPPAHREASPFGVAVCLPDREERDALYRKLHDERLPVVVPQWPLFDASHQRFPAAWSLRQQLLCLPTHQQLNEESIRQIAAVVREAVRG